MERAQAREIKQALLQKLTVALIFALVRGDGTPDQAVGDFTEKYKIALTLFNGKSQDSMLKAAMEYTGIDLSHWLG